jgi:putative membrane protein
VLYEILIGLLAGIVAGSITGLIPGIHTNLISMTLVTLSPVLLQHTSAITVATFIISMSITHSFLGVIPSTFLGAPDADNALTALPAHRLLLKGQAYDAIRLTVIGSVGCLILGIILAPGMFLFMKYAYPFLSTKMFWVLLIPLSFIIFRESRRWYNLSFFLFAGSLGYIVFNIPFIKEPLFPLLSGLFGVSILISSFFDKIHIPKQKKEATIKLPYKEQGTALLGGFIAGALTSFLPGLGSSQGAVLAQSAFRKISEEGFLILVGGINTVNFVLSIIAYYAIDRARNGSIIAVSSFIPEFTINHIIIFMILGVISGAIATKLCLSLTNGFIFIIQKVNYQILTGSVLVLILFMTIILSGFFGILILAASTALGILSIKMNVAKCHLMGCLLLPVLIYFLP